MLLHYIGGHCSNASTPTVTMSHFGSEADGDWQLLERQGPGTIRQTPGIEQHKQGVHRHSAQVAGHAAGKQRSGSSLLRN